MNKIIRTDVHYRVWELVSRSIYKSVEISIWDSVWDSVRNSVRNSVEVSVYKFVDNLSNEKLK